MSSSCVRMSDSRSNSANTRRRNSATPQNTSPNSSTPTTFSNVSSIHGVGRASQGSLPVKAFYVGLVVAAIAATIVFSAFLLEDIVSNPSTVTRTVKARSSLDLPKITICNLNPLRESALDDFLQYVSDNDDDDSETEAVYFGSGIDCPVCIDGEIDSNLFREKYSELPNNLKSAYGHQLSNMLLSCEFQGEACSDSDFTSYVDDEYGNCYSFSSQSVSNSGSVSGLVLELDAEPDEYLSQVSETVGIRVLLEPQATPSCLKYDDLAVSPGQDNFISLKSALATGPCAKNYVTVSGGAWPTSSSKSRSLLSSVSGDGTSVTVSPSGPTTSPPDLDAVDGSGGGSPGAVVGFVDVGDEFSHHILSKREAEPIDRFTSKENAPSNYNVDAAPSVSKQKENEDILQYKNFNTQNHNEGIDGNYDAESAIKNEHLDWEYYKQKGVQYTDFRSDDTASYYSHLERVRRDAAEETNETTLTDAESVDSARDRFSKVRVFYSSMDEEVESETQVYPWYVATALIGGQLALLCSISAIAIIEGIECFIRFVGRNCQKLKPDNKVGVRNAWE